MGACISGTLLIMFWSWQHGTLTDQVIPFPIVVLTAVLMPLRIITNISVIIFSVSDRGPIIAAQMAIQSAVMFISTLVSLFAFRLGGTSLFVGAVGGQFAALCV